MIDEDLKLLLCCPKCKSSLDQSGNDLKCDNCNITFIFKNGIYHFTVKSKQSSLFRKMWIKKLSRTNKNSFETPGISHLLDKKAILRIVPQAKNKILLDAGCGTGLSTMSLLEKGAKIIFLDIIPETLLLVQKLIKLNKFEGKALFVLGDIPNLPLKSGILDIIWSGGVLEHMYSLKKPIAEFYRIMKSKGDLILTVPNKFGFQRIIASLIDIINRYPNDHFEKDFLYSHLLNLFPRKFFPTTHVHEYSLEQFFYEIMLPNCKFLSKISDISYQFYEKSVRILSKLLFHAKFGISWFIVHTKKK